MSSPWFKTDNKLLRVFFEALTIYLKRAVAKDAGEDGSGQHGEDGQDHRHAGYGYFSKAKYGRKKYEHTEDNENGNDD